MSSILIGVNAVLAAAIVGMVMFILIIRMVAGGRIRRENQFRPGAERAISEYLADGCDPPCPAGRAERTVMFNVAVEALGDLRGAERTRLAQLLQRFGYTDDAISGLRSRRRFTRRRAAEALSAIGTPAAESSLRAALDDPDALVRTTCARTLAEVGSADAVPEIIAIARRDAPKTPGAAAAVVLALAERWPAALAPLLGPDVPAEVRFVAITLAGDLRLAEYAPLLMACLTDHDDLAASAAQGLGRIGEVDAVGPLTELMRDGRRSQAVRAAATGALGVIGQPSVVPALEAQLDASDWVLQDAAVQALARLGDPGEAALRRAASADRGEIRELAEAALAP